MALATAGDALRTGWEARTAQATTRKGIALARHETKAGKLTILVLIVLLLASFNSSGLAAPAVTSIVPAAGPSSGNTPFTITGSGFVSGASVWIGGVAASQVKVVSASTIIGITSTQGGGVYRVLVINAPADSGWADSLFTHNGSTDFTKTSKSDFETSGSTITELTTTGLDSTMRWIDWTPGTTGSMSNGTYYYVVTASNGTGQTEASIETPAIVLAGADDAVQLDWTPISGALQYRLYRTTTQGTYTSPSLIATLSEPGYTDDAASPSAGEPPAAGSATGDLFLRAGTAPATTYSSGPDALENVSKDAFSIARPNGTFLIVYAGNTQKTSIYDPVANSMSAGPDVITDDVEEGAHGLKRPNGTFLIVHGDDRTTTSIYDPVANTMTAGPAADDKVDKGGHALERPNGTFLIVHGGDSKTTSLYDPVANTFSAGPGLNEKVELGAFSIERPDGQFLIVCGGGTKKTDLYDPVANSVTAGPDLIDKVDRGGHAIQRPDGRYLIVCGGASKPTNIYDPVANSVVDGPDANDNVDEGGHSIQLADGTFLVINGNKAKKTNLYDPVANTMAAGSDLADNIGDGAHSIHLPDGRYLILRGDSKKDTYLFDAGWTRTGSYVSEKINPTDINWWNVISWVRDLDDTVTTVQIKTATSAAGLDAASWRAAVSGDSIGAAPGEDWLQLRVDFARAIPVSSGALDDLWTRWVAEFRSWARPDVLSITANYTPTTLSVSPNPATLAFGAHPLNTWLAADSSSLVNDGSAGHNLVGRVATLTDGTNTWSLSNSSNGADQIRAQWSITSAAGPWTDIAAYDQNFLIAPGIAAGDSVRFYMRIQTPTTTSSLLQHGSDLTVTAQ